MGSEITKQNHVKQIRYTFALISNWEYGDTKVHSRIQPDSLYPACMKDAQNLREAVISQVPDIKEFDAS